MKSLSIDIETYSECSLISAGQYRYAESEDFEILLFAYSVDNGDVKVVDLAMGEKLPEEIISALTDENVIKWAYNAAFERICISRYLRDLGILSEGEFLPGDQWRCSSVWSSYLGYPASLKGVGEALNLEEQKMAEGKDLIELFCWPQDNLDGRRVFPADEPEKWKIFKAYNKRDVEVELQVKEKLSWNPVPEKIWEEYFLEQRINDLGICVDVPFVKQALAFGEIIDKETAERFKDITGLDISCPYEEFSTWIDSHENFYKEENCAASLENLVSLLSNYRKSSVSKYKSLLDMVCKDGRIHGATRFYGNRHNGTATCRIGRFLNTPPSDSKALKMIRDLITDGNFKAFKTEAGSNPCVVLNNLISSAFISEDGNELIEANFKDAEINVLVDLLGTDSTEKNLKKYRKFYRKIKDVAEGPNSKETEFLMEALPEAEEVFDFYNFIWKGILEAVANKKVCENYGLKIFTDNDTLAVGLPSGRNIYYADPELLTDRDGLPAVFVKGISSDPTIWKTGYLNTAAVILDIVKGIARDRLYEFMSGKDFMVMHTKDTVYFDIPEEDVLRAS